MVIMKGCVDRCIHLYSCELTDVLTLPSCRQTNPEYDPERCFAFVHDLSDEEATYPVPDGTLDVIVLIFVLSALHPDKYELLSLSSYLFVCESLNIVLVVLKFHLCLRMQASISRLARLLKPGGVMLLRDYGRYDMAQLRFKKG